MAKRVVLVTGVAGRWGARVARQLSAEWDLHVIGLDAQAPETEIKGLDLLQADIRNPLLAELFKSENVHTVCHLTFVEDVRPAESAFDINVIGTLTVMGACVEAGVRKIVLKSSTAVYGARPDNPAFITENHPLNGSRRYSYTRDLVEIEAFCNGFRRQVPVALTILRFPNIIGPTCDTPMTRFLQNPSAPVLWGFDPMMQIIHEDDVVGALTHAVLDDVPGVFNVAAEGDLPLSKLAALAGKFAMPVFHLLAYCGVALGAGRLAPIELDYLRYPWVGDLAKMRAEFGFAPRYTAAQALREFAEQWRLRQYQPESTTLADDEERLRANIERRRRARSAREQGPATASSTENASDEQ